MALVLDRQVETAVVVREERAELLARRADPDESDERQSHRRTWACRREA